MRNSIGALALTALTSGCISSDTPDYHALRFSNEATRTAVNDCGARPEGRAETLRLRSNFENIPGFQAGFKQGLQPAHKGELLDENCLLAAASQVNGVLKIGKDNCNVEGSTIVQQGSRKLAVGVTVDCMDSVAATKR